MPERTCSFPGCRRDHYSLGLCRLHYQRQARHGDAAWTPPTAADLFWAKVKKGDGCWVWTAALSRDGYGQFGVTRDGKTRMAQAHRVAYEIILGPIPEGMQLDIFVVTGDACGRATCILLLTKRTPWHRARSASRRPTARRPTVHKAIPMTLRIRTDGRMHASVGHARGNEPRTAFADRAA